MKTELQRMLADPNNPRSISARARARRWARLRETFPDLESMKVLDLGGTPRFWRTVEDRPAHVTVVNVRDEPCDEPWMQMRVTDACAPDLGGETFDAVISNSLLEHVGGHWRRQQVADVIHAAADRHWVQTPYRYFPIEPHWVAPGMQFFPVATRARISAKWPLGSIHVPADEVMDYVLEVELVSIAEMRHYFPTSTIWKERFAGLPKSLVAIK